MIITISGKTASGKDTIGKILAEKTGFRLLSFSFKNFLDEKTSKKTLDFEKHLDLNFDKKFDQWEREKVIELKEENLIVIGRLSAINLQDLADLKIFLYASEEERAKRLAKRENLIIEEAKKLLKERDETFENRIKKVYGIKYDDPKYYDIIINTNNKKPEEIANLILKLI